MFIKYFNDKQSRLSKNTLHVFSMNIHKCGYFYVLTGVSLSFYLGLKLNVI